MDPKALIETTVKQVVPDAQVHPTDLTGGGDHWFVAVVSPSFEGQRSFARQRPILTAFTPHIQGGALHALDLKCVTPAEVEEKGMPEPFVPHKRGEGNHPGAWK